MRELLDTNVLVRILAGQPLPRPAKKALEKDGLECFVSIVSFWELAMKPQLGLRLADVEDCVGRMGAHLLPLRISHLSTLAALPMYNDHRDPFDRLLIAQAITEDLRMISSDTRFSDYRKLRLLWD